MSYEFLEKSFARNSLLSRPSPQKITCPGDKVITSLEGCLSRQRRVVLLFSGGLDSGLLLALAAPVLGTGLIALTYRGPHIPPGELAAAWQLARRFQVRHLIQEFDPLQLADFRENTPQRCYACKKAIIARAWEMAGEVAAEAVWDATNMDDLSDFRPGLRAARELGVVSPFLVLGWGKKDIREQSRRLGLDWQRPPQSCLATRFPYNTVLTKEDLARVGEAEAWLRSRGFTHVRLRVQGDRTRLELNAEEWPQFLNPGVRRAFVALVNRLGWEGLELEMVGEGGVMLPRPSPQKNKRNHTESLVVLN